MDLFSSLKSFFRSSSTLVDNWAFTLHCKVTAGMLIAFSILVTGKQYFGDPIDCISRDDIPTKLLNTFCWIHTTFSLPDAWEKKVGDEVPYPGVDKYTPGEKRVYHAYYQWVCFFLFLQGIMFYIPKYFWKAMEGGRIKNLILGLDSPIVSEEAKVKNRMLIVQYFLSTIRQNGMYFYCFVAAEIMNFVNVVGQIFLVDIFLGGEFSTYGINVIGFSEWEPEVRYDPMIKVFPRITKCTFHRYGSSGDVQRHDSMCLLPINNVNEKIFIFLWFWFVILAIISGLALIYRFATIKCKTVRFFSTKSRTSLCDPDNLEIVVKKFALGDWLLLDLLAKNVDSQNFRDIVNDLAKELDGSMFERKNGFPTATF
ncbi:innexin inx2-like [Argiope bruennichi]|uniref:innexin inx2-like n=1 Tax=Argiope bruennichi TaxID=94029 RepID=UPI002494F33A|nr:innexin inx2-like [Argiope bruennichi]XP_055950195.1 innexin inx2-like [Argiope bruennichi]